MEPETGLRIDNSDGPEPESRADKPGQPAVLAHNSNWMCNSREPRLRPSEANGFIVYTRRKRLKSKSEGTIVILDKLRHNSGCSTEAVANCDAVIGGGNSDINGGSEVTLNGDGEIVNLETENVKSVCAEVGEMQSEEIVDAKTRKMEIKMSKKIVMRERLTTVRELFATGLLEGYPVFYNGGKKGFALRGTVKDSGILCSCGLCKGAKVIPACQFEIHACKSYRRASQYICLENGKSLLDVVKECQKSSAKTLEETIQNFIGPLPLKESVNCQNCNGSFLATSAANKEPLCDSCMIIVNSEVDAESVRTSPPVPLLGLSKSENVEDLDSPIKYYRRGRRKRKHSELDPNVKPVKSSPGRPTLMVSTRNEGQWKTTTMLSQPEASHKVQKEALVSLSKSSSDLNPSDGFLTHGLLQNKTPKKISHKLSNTLSSGVSISGSPSVSRQSNSSAKITKKDHKMHKLVFKDGGLPDGTEVAYYSNGKKLRDGYKMGSGIICRCCNIMASPSQFEAHAGWASRRKPYMYIYTSNGVSLHEYAISLLKQRKFSAKDNDDLCTICADGGKLVLCDGCPRAFHKECASLLSIPQGKWYCTYCQNKFEREKYVGWNSNALAAGRVSGIDSKEIKNRCIRVVKDPDEAELIACVLCRGYDYSKSGFGPRTVILCDQCEKEYHVGCLKKLKMADLKELPKGKWFCSVDCKSVYSVLHNLLKTGAEMIPDPSLDILKKKLVNNNVAADHNFELQWRLLNGTVTSRETRILLSQAVALFHDCFDPIVDTETGRDFIPTMVYGRNIRGQDFSGMYCSILTINSTVVSAAILRIFGQEMAELPLVATRIGYQGKGYFQILYCCIEKLLAFLNVKTLVLPATDEAKSIWTQKFGFRKIAEEMLLDYRKICWQMVTFKGTSMLEKPVPKCRIIDDNQQDSEGPLH